MCGFLLEVYTSVIGDSERMTSQHSNSWVPTVVFRQAVSCPTQWLIYTTNISAAYV